MRIRKIFKIAVILIIPLSSVSFPQTCGFGCLGLSGIYGGYSYQFYKPDGLNEFLGIHLLKISLPAGDIEFGKGEGFRIGANIFRAQFDNYFLTAKGYYQFIKENQESTDLSKAGNPIFKSTLEMNHWGLGIDLGVPIFKYLSWKIVEGGINFYTADLSNTYDTPDYPVTEEKYTNADVSMGYYVGTGLIINIIPDYISIEGSAFYNQVTVDDLINDQGYYLFGDGSKYKLIEKGSVSATVQLNIGVPL